MIFYGFILLIPLLIAIVFLFIYMSKKSDRPGQSATPGTVRPKTEARAHGREVRMSR